MATYAEMKEMFDEIRADFRYDHELNGCLNCGICTATCPSAQFYDYSPREIVQLLWTENVEQIYDAMQEKNLGLCSVHDLCSTLSFQEFSRWTGHDHARSLHSPWYAIGQRCVAPLWSRNAQTDYHG